MMLPPRLTSLIATTCLCAGLAGVETELRLGPEELVIDSEFQSQYLYEGAVRTEATTWRNHVRGRFYDIGLQLDAYLLLEDDEQLDLDIGSVFELRARADYLLEIEGIAQIIPNVRYQYFPEFEDEVDEPVWVGVDGWYLLPVEGLELGGGVSADLTDEHGWYVEFGMREFFQQAPLDLTAWQLVTAGSGDYHEWTSGADDAGFGAINLGALLTLPLPWQNCYATIRTEVSTWLMDEDRDAVDDDLEFAVSAGFEWRPNY